MMGNGRTILDVEKEFMKLRKLVKEQARRIKEYTKTNNKLRLKIIELKESKKYRAVQKAKAELGEVVYQNESLIVANQELSEKQSKIGVGIDKLREKLEEIWRYLHANAKPDDKGLKDIERKVDFVSEEHNELWDLLL